MDRENFLRTVARSVDVPALRRMRENAARNGQEDLVGAVDDRITLLQENWHLDPTHPVLGVLHAALKADLDESIRAFRALKAEERGRDCAPSRTLQMFKARGVIAAMRTIVGAQEPSGNFVLMVRNGRGSLTLEALLLKFRALFADDTRALMLARQRLRANGIPLPAAYGT